MLRRPSRAALYERLLAEKQQEVDWLRAQLGVSGFRAATLPLPPAATLTDGTPAMVDDGGWVSEAEEAQKIIEATGLSAVHLPEILSGLGYGDSEL